MIKWKNRKTKTKPSPSDNLTILTSEIHFDIVWKMSEALRVLPSADRPTVERRSCPQFDAVLLHTFWISRETHPPTLNVRGEIVPVEDTFRGSLRNRLATRSAAFLYHAGRIGKIVVTTGNVKGPSYPTTARITADELIQKYHVPKEDIVVMEDAYSTEEEFDGFERAIREHGWSNVANISYEVERDWGKSPKPVIGDAQVTFISVESIIRKYDKPRVWDLVRGFAHSRYGRGFTAYVKARGLVRKVPALDRRAEAKNRALRGKDNSKLNDFVVHQFDKFKS